MLCLENIQGENWPFLCLICSTIELQYNPIPLTFPAGRRDLELLADWKLLLALTLYLSPYRLAVGI